MTLELGERLGAGRTAEVYAVAGDPARVVKLFDRGTDPAAVDREVTYSRVAAAAGIPSPEVFGTVEVDDRYGIVVERVDGPHLADTMRERPWTVVGAARTAADAHRRMHACDGGDLPALHERLRERIEAGPVAVRHRESILTALDGLPTARALCHGDFHPENVLVADGREVVIDWPDAAAGHPAADVARSSLLLRLAVEETSGRGGDENGEDDADGADDDGSETASGGTARLRAGYFRGMVETYRRVYLRTYLADAEFERDLVERFELPVAAARLAEGVPGPEERRLRDRIGDLLARQE